MRRFSISKIFWGGTVLAWLLAAGSGLQAESARSWAEGLSAVPETDSTTWKPGTQPPIHFESNSLQYEETDQVITASGNVKVRQSSYTFYSQHALFNVPGKELSAWDQVKFSDIQGNEIRAKSLKYGMTSGSAELLETEGAFGPWIFASRKVTRDNEGNFTLERARLSTCEVDFSKYHLYGHKIKVMPGKRLTVQHALFRLGPVPVLYLPYYYYSLGEKHLAFQIFPGQNKSEGTFVRTIWGYPTTEATYTQVFLDYLSKRGMGTGGEVDYYHKDLVKGSVYGYRIQDKIAGRERWNARLFHWQKLSQRWLLQSQINQLSDDSFPNDFYREDYNRVVRDPKSSVAVTYQKKNNFFRVFGERIEAFDPGTTSFYADDAQSPKIEFNHVQSPLGFWGLEKIVSASFANRLAGRNSFQEVLSRNYRRESEAQASVLKRLSLGRRTTLIPKASVRNRWIDRPQGSEVQEPFVQLVDIQPTVRQGLGDGFNMDWTYHLSHRLQLNQGDDQGRESHSLAFFAQADPAYWASFRFDTSHNLPRLKGESLSPLERKNYTPLRGEMSLNPRRNLELFFREEYLLSDALTGSAHPLSTQSELILGDRMTGGNYFLIGTSYFSSRDDAFELRNKARYSLTQTLKLEGTLRTLLSYGDGNFVALRRGDFLEKEVTVRQEWRCWELSFLFRERAGVVEFLFNLELKLDRVDRQKGQKNLNGEEFYQWKGIN